MTNQQRVKYIQDFIRWSNNLGRWAWWNDNAKMLGKNVVTYFEKVCNELAEQGKLESMSARDVNHYVYKQLFRGAIKEPWAEIFYNKMHGPINVDKYSDMCWDVCDPLIEDIKDELYGSGELGASVNSDYDHLKAISYFLKHINADSRYAKTLLDSIKEGIQVLDASGQLEEHNADNLVDYWYQTRIEEIPEEIVEQIIQYGHHRADEWRKILKDISSDLRDQLLAAQGHEIY